MTEVATQNSTVENPSEKMTPMQALFVIEYLKDLNATHAAERAGYSKDYAKEIGYQNLQKKYIKRAIEEQLDARASRTLVTADKVLYELWLIASCDPLDAFENNGDLKPLDQIPVEVRKCIAGLEVEAMYEMNYEEKGHPEKVEVGLLKKLKFWDKGRAQENLAKHLRLLAERFEVGNIDGSNFKFPGITEVFVDSPEALQQAMELSAQPEESQVSTDAIITNTATDTTAQPQ